MRFSQASTLTALAVLVAPAVLTRAQEAVPESSAKAEASGSNTSAKVVTPKVAVPSTTAEAEPMPSQAEVSKKVIAGRKAKVARKHASAKAKQASIERLRMEAMWMQMLAMMRQSELELQRAQLQAAQLEGMPRREAEESILRLQIALANARAMEFQQDRETMLARDDPDRYRDLMQAQIDAYNAQQRAIQNLTQSVTGAIRERRGLSAGPSVGTSGSGNSWPGATGQSATSTNSGGGVTRSQPAPAPVRSLADKDKDDMAKMRSRYP